MEQVTREPSQGLSAGELALPLGLTALATFAVVVPAAYALSPGIALPITLVWADMALAVTLPIATAWRQGSSHLTVGLPVLAVAMATACVWVATLVHLKAVAVCERSTSCEGYGILLAALPFIGLALMVAAAVMGALVKGLAWLERRFSRVVVVEEPDLDPPGDGRA